MEMFRLSNLQGLLAKAEAKRALGTYGFGVGGLGISGGIQAAGAEALKSAEAIQPLLTQSSIVEQLFPSMFADGTMQIVGGKWFIMGMAFSDMISIILGLISCGVLIVRLVADLDAWLYRRKMEKQLAKIAADIEKNKK